MDFGVVVLFMLIGAVAGFFTGSAEIGGAIFLVGLVIGRIGRGLKVKGIGTKSEIERRHGQHTGNGPRY